MTVLEEKCMADNMVVYRIEWLDHKGNTNQRCSGGNGGAGMV